SPPESTFSSPRIVPHGCANARPGEPFPPGLFFLGVSAELFADADEEAAALTPLRRADSDPASATDLVAVVEQVEHVGADRQSLEHSRSVEVLSNPRVEHPVAGKGAAVGND